METKKAIRRQTEITNDPELKEKSLLNKNAFTRKRKNGMIFPEAVSFILDMRTTTIQSRLNTFYYNVKGCDPISQPAFTKLRAQFDHTLFEVMFREIMKEEYSGEYELPTWHGYHVFAVDGSYLQLPHNPELEKEYGTRGGGDRPQAGCSVLYDLLHGWAIDPIITHNDMNEREQLMKHITYLCENMPDIAKYALILLDRGYPSQDIAEFLEECKLKFCIRCANEFSNYTQSAPLGSSIVTLSNGVTVRIVKFTLSNGETETLMTNLFDLPDEEFPDLYAMRWGIETMYHRLKQVIGIEKFSGKTPNSIRQDFWASMVLHNNAAIFQKEADEAVEKRQEEALRKKNEEKNENRKNKHKYRARTSDLVVILRDRLIFATLCGYRVISELEFNDIMRELARAVSPVRAGRHFPRVHKENVAVNHYLKSRL